MFKNKFATKVYHQHANICLSYILTRYATKPLQISPVTLFQLQTETSAFVLSFSSYSLFVSFPFPPVYSLAKPCSCQSLSRGRGLWNWRRSLCYDWLFSSVWTDCFDHVDPKGTNQKAINKEFQYTYG